MHDIKAIRDNPDAYIEGWTVRGVENAREVVAEILGLDRDLRAAQTRGQEALAQRNAASHAPSKRKRCGSDGADEMTPGL